MQIGTNCAGEHSPAALQPRRREGRHAAGVPPLLSGLANIHKGARSRPAPRATGLKDTGGGHISRALGMPETAQARVQTEYTQGVEAATELLMPAKHEPCRASSISTAATTLPRCTCGQNGRHLVAYVV